MSLKIRDLIEIEKHFAKNKKTPCDIVEALEQETYSESKDEDIKLGDMHLTHYIRRQLRDEKKDDKTISELNKKIRELKNTISDIHARIQAS